MKNLKLVRELAPGPGWTMEFDGQSLVVTGGTHADAYSPVSLAPADLAQLIADMQSLISMADG